MTKRIGRIACTLAVLGLCRAAMAQDEPKKLPFRISKETTYITEPLTADGLPDYVAAINSTFGKGVTPENNAAVLLMQVLDPDEFFPEGQAEMYLKALGLKDKPKGPFLDIGGLAALSRTLGNAEQADDDPKMLKWLKDNDALLDKLVAATKRERYFLPFALDIRENADKLKPMNMALMPRLFSLRWAGKAPCIRSRLRLAQGDWQGAIEDVVAAYTLGNRVLQGATFMERMVGWSTISLSDDQVAHLVMSGNLSGDQLLALHKALLALPQPALTGRSMRVTERALVLDLVTVLAARFQELKKQDVASDKELGGLVDLARELGGKNIDWNGPLARVNGYYDSLSDALDLSTWAEKSRQFDLIQKRLAEIKDEAAAMAQNKPDMNATHPSGANLGTYYAGNVILARYAVQVSNIEKEICKQLQQHQLTLLALALALHKADSGEYPAKLDDLAPRYIPAVPKDYFTEKPLVYRRTADGYILYSLGPNTKDDGGSDEDDADDIVVKTPPSEEF